MSSSTPSRRKGPSEAQNQNRIRTNTIACIHENVAKLEDRYLYFLALAVFALHGITYSASHQPPCRPFPGHPSEHLDCASSPSRFLPSQHLRFHLCRHSLRFLFLWELDLLELLVDLLELLLGLLLKLVIKFIKVTVMVIKSLAALLSVLHHKVGAYDLLPPPTVYTPLSGEAFSFGSLSTVLNTHIHSGRLTPAPQ